jgi:hypothetical protein
MKAEQLVQQQFDAAKAAWEAEKVALQAEVQSLKERLVGQVVAERPKLKAEAKAEKAPKKKA